MDAPSVDVEEHLPLRDFDVAYHVSSTYPRTAVTTAFLWEGNLRRLLGAIEAGLGALLNRKVMIMPTRAMYSTLVDLLLGTRNYDAPSDVARAVELLNAQVYSEQVRENFSAMRHRELFYKWFVFKTRQRTISPPKLTNGRGRWDGLSTADYTTGDPKARWMAQFRGQQDANRAVGDCETSDIGRIVSGQERFRPDVMAALRPELEF